MQVLVILCHPEPGSFNHAVTASVTDALAAAGHEVLFHDLYREGFDPVLSPAELHRGVSFDEHVQQHAAELEASGGFVLIHPDWWGQPPALLKGWVDRVLRPGVAYELEGEEFAERQPRPLLVGKRALVFATRDAAEPSDLLARIWQEGVFAFCGIRSAACHVLNDLRHSSAMQRREWLKRVAGIVRRSFAPAAA